MTATTSPGAAPSTGHDRSAVPGPRCAEPGCGCAGSGTTPSAATVLPGGIVMWAPGHEPPPEHGRAASSGPATATGHRAPPAPPPHGSGTRQPHAPAPRGAPRPAAPPSPPPAPARVGDPTAPADRDRTRTRTAELVRGVAEVLAGRRPPAHLTGLATPAVLRYLAAARPGRAGRPRPAGRGGRAGAPGCAPAEAPGRRPRLHLSHPHPDATEVCTTVLVGGRPRALALRLDRAGAGAPWTVTAARLL